MPVKFKLSYFPARGRAEVARLLFAAAGQEFEDVRLTFEQWPGFKPGKYIYIKYITTVNTAANVDLDN